MHTEKLTSHPPVGRDTHYKPKPQSAQTKSSQEQMRVQAYSQTCQCSHWVQTALLDIGLGMWNWDRRGKTYDNPQGQNILGYEVEEIENHHKEWKWIFSQGKVLQWDESGKSVIMIGTHKDITKAKWAEEALQQQVKQEQLLRKLRERMYSCSRLEPILQTAVEEARQFLQTDRTLICRFLPDDSGVVAFESVTAALTTLQGMNVKIPIPASIPNRRVDGCISYIIQEFDRYIQAASKVSGQIDSYEYPVRASLVIPIILGVEEDDFDLGVEEENFEVSSSIENPLWGLLIAHDCHSSRQWQSWEIDSIEQLSVEIAIAIKQCQMFELVQREIASRQFAEAKEREKSRQLDSKVDELKQAQGQLLQNEKMANLGQLVADMANEINNPVNFIHKTLEPASQYAEDLIGLLELYQHNYSTSDTVALQLQHLDVDFMKTDLLKLLWSMRAGSERIKEIVFALQSFSHFDDGHRKKVDLHEGIDSVLRILQHRLKEQPDQAGIQVIREFGDLPLVECYPGELNLVFMNILTNAIDALEERMKLDYSFTPQILIHTETVSRHLSLVSSNEFSDEQLPSNKHKVIIRISDNGKGILPHIQRHIFEPFFTTKPVGKAKGLGLSISQQIIVDKHQGKLRCNSQIGQGTEFVIEMNTKATRYADMRKHASF